MGYQLSAHGTRFTFSEVPIITSVITREYAEILGSSPARPFVTGTIVGEKITELMDDALRVRPQTKRIALIAGTSANERYSERGYRKGLELYKDKIGLIDLTKLSMEETLSRVGSLPDDTFVVYSSIFKDGAGKTFAPCEALSLVAKASRVPVFGVLETYLGRGIVGGHMVSFTEHGKEAASMAVKIMEGQSPGSIPFGGEKAYIYAYDWRELKRWGIPETAVAAGAEIRYRVPTFWEAHKSAIIGTITLVVVETVLIFGLLINVVRRRKAERSLIESEERLSLAADSAGAGLWSLDLVAGRFWETDKTRDLYDVPPNETITFDRFLEVVHPDDRDLVRQGVDEMAQSDEEGGLEYRIVRTDGTTRWIASQGHVQGAESGNHGRLMGVSIDITDRKRMDEELRNRLQEIENLKQQLQKENVYLRDEVVLSFPHDNIIGQSAPIRRVLGSAEKSIPN